MTRTRYVAVAVGLAAALLVAPWADADERPRFQMPVPCGQTWTTSTHSGHASVYDIDMIRAGGGTHGVPALASAAGTVSISRWHHAAGNYVVLDHGRGWVTRYLHLEYRSVAEGQRVTMGTQLGVVGNTGNSTGSHLHYEQKLDGRTVRSIVDGHAIPVNWSYHEHYERSRNCGRPPVRPPTGAGRLVSSWSADGRLETFAAADDGVWHSYQLEINGAWSRWRALGGPRNAQLAIAANRDGRLELFALSAGSFKRMVQTEPNGAWSPWRSFGPGADYVAAGHNADGRIEVFASDADGVVHRRQTDDGWSKWRRVGGPGGARLELGLARNGRLQLFALSRDTFAHRRQTAGGWSGWEHFGTGGHDLSVDHNTDGRIEVFVSNAEGVYRKWQIGASTWSGWATTGGPRNAELATERSADGRIDVVATKTGGTQHARQIAPNRPYTDWRGFGPGGTEVATSHNADGRVEVFASRPDGTYHRRQNRDGTWSGWAYLNGRGPVG